MARGLSFVLVALLVSNVLVGLAPTGSAAEAKLSPVTLPQPVVGTQAVQLGSYVYLLGGRLSDGTYSNTITRFDPASGANTTVATFPDVTVAPGSSQRYAGSVAVYGTKIFYFGGATTVQGTVGGQPARLPKPIPDIVVFDTQTGSISTLTSSCTAASNKCIPGGGAWGMMEATVGSTAYLFGGFTLDLSTYTFQRHDWILAFDLAGQTLTTLSATLPYPLQDGGIAYLATPSPQIYLFGGLGDNNTANLCPGTYNQSSGQTNRPSLCLTNQIVRWDPQLQASAVVTPTLLPYRVQYAEGGTAHSERGTLGYVLGGLLVDGTASQAILSFDPSSSSPLQTLAPHLDPGVFGSGVTQDGSTITLWGGRQGEANQLTNAIITFNPSPTAPFPPAALSVTRNANALHLDWQPPTYDGDSPVTSYKVYRTGPDGVETTLSGGTTALSFDDTATKPGANYTYRVTASNSYGESEGALASTAASTTTPSAVQHFAAYAGNAQVVLNWQPPLETGGMDITGYHLVCNCSSRPVSLSAGTLSYTWTGLQNGVSYTFTARAVNPKGEGTASPTLAAAPAPVPDAPQSVQAQATGGSGGSAGVALSWANAATAVNGYLVLRGTTPDAVTQPIVNLTADQTSYADTAVAHGQTYYYAIVSFNSVGRSPPSMPVSVSLVDVPSPPADVRAQGLPGLVQLSWDPPTNLGGADPSSITYAVVRTAPSGSSRIISPPDLNVLSYADRTATYSTTYSYAVITENPRHSEPSLAVTATAVPPIHKPPTAALTALPAIVAAGDPVTLDASRSVQTDGGIVQYAYDFGDGSDVKLSTLSTLTHAYATNGTYMAKVIVTDDQGNTSAPATTRVIVGTLTDTGVVDTGSGLSGTGAHRTTGVADAGRPGAGSGKVPGPGVGLFVAAIVGVALAARRHSRR